MVRGKGVVGGRGETGVGLEGGGYRGGGEVVLVYVCVCVCMCNI